MSFGSNIRAERDRLGWTQNELARRAQVNQPTLQRIESDPEKDPALSIAVKIARALGVSVESLMGQAGVSPLIHAEPATSDRLQKLEERVDLLTDLLRVVAGSEAERLFAEVAEEQRKRRRRA